MKYHLYSLILFISIYGCNSPSSNSKYQQQFSVAHDFLIKLQNDDSAGVKQIIGVKLSDISKNEEILSFEVGQLSRLMHLHNLPTENTYRIIEYPQTDPRLLDVMIPIEKDTLQITFAKFLPINKIWRYYWHRQISNDNLIIMPPGQ